MKKNTIIGLVALVVIVVVGVVLIASNGSSSNLNNMSDMKSSSSDSSKATATNSVAIQNFAFSPAKITVKVGTTVTWTNKDSVAHTVTVNSGSGPNSKNLAQNQSYSYKFTKVGTFAYHCAIHTDMLGTVVVTN